MLERGVVAWVGKKFKVGLVRGALEVSWLLCGAVSEAALRKEVGGIKLVSPPRGFEVSKSYILPNPAWTWRLWLKTSISTTANTPPSEA